MSAAPKKSRRWMLLLLAAVLVLAPGAYFLLKPSPFDGKVNALGLDLAQPDALIRSQSLSRLPPDLLRVPLARDVLTEEFVDYYEQHEQRLALSGTLRRLAYEHQLSLPERVLESVFDEPAEVALWRGGDGALKHFAVAMTRNGLARTLQMLLPLAPEVQLSTVGELHGGKARLLVLEYGYGHRLLLAARGDRVVALSDPGMLLQSADEAAEGEEPVQDGAAAAVITRLLDMDADEVSPFAEHFALAAPGGKGHQLVVGASFYAMGYQAFAPGVAALDFSFDDQGGWRTAMLVDGAALPAGGLDGSALWSALPHGASLCALAPVAWDRLSPLAEKLGVPVEKDKAAGGLGDLFTGPATVCWYGDSRLYTPLFVATLKADVDAATSARLTTVFGAATGIGGEVEAEADGSGADGLRLWRKQVPSVFGSGPADERQLVPSLASSGRLVLFSPDAALVDKAVDVAAKRYPALADSLPAASQTIALLDPAPMAALLRKEVFAALPRSEETLLRNAADAHLLPRLQVLSSYPALRLVRGGEVAQGRQWQPLQWESAAPRR